MINFINLLTGVPTYGGEIVNATKVEDIFRNRFLYNDKEIKTLETENIGTEEIQERVVIGHQIKDMLQCIGAWPSDTRDILWSEL